MKIVFAGTPEFAAESLRGLIRARHEIALVLTQPDRPAGRGLVPTPSQVKRLANEHGLEVYQPDSLKLPEVERRLASINPDVMVVVAYGLIVSPSILRLPRYGCINIHASLLPRWRGAAPIARAILAGDRESGISIMRMEAGLDTGPILMQQKTAILENETAQTLHDMLAALGRECIVSTLDKLVAGTHSATQQIVENATYATKLTKDEAKINWANKAVEIERAVRAFNPFPGAQARIQGQDLKIWGSVLAEGVSGGIGEVIAVSPKGVVVACGQGSVALTVLQKPGGKRLPVAEFVRGFPLNPGDRFER